MIRGKGQENKCQSKLLCIYNGRGVQLCVEWHLKIQGDAEVNSLLKTEGKTLCIQTGKKIEISCSAFLLLLTGEQPSASSKLEE